MKILIKNVFFIDGSGAPGVESARLLFEDGVICQVGPNISDTAADDIFDGMGLTLAPGFIDAHSHSDMSIMAAPEAFGKVSQGVTTEVVGNCGLSAFPVTGHNREHLNELWRNYDERVTWNSCAEYLAELESRDPAVNIVPLTGHNTLRAAVVGYEKKELADFELQEMKRLLADSLKQGAAGFSTGLLYVPGKFSDSDELTALLATLARYDKPYTTHLRSEGNELEEAFHETFAAAKKAGQKYVHISHLKIAGRKNWQKINRMLELLAIGRNAGLTITADRYPYTEAMTQLSVILPAPYEDMDDVALQNYLYVPGNFDKVLQALAQLPEERWETVRLVATNVAGMEPFLGKGFLEISEAAQKPPHQICAEILQQDAAGSLAAFQGMDRDNMLRILKQPFTACGSDESSRPVDFSFGRSHPRGFGSFPRFIKILRNAGVPLEHVIYRVTGLPAAIFGLNGYGLLQPGFSADMTLFDPGKLADNATFANPHAPASGISAVWRAGKLIKNEI